MSPDGTAPPMQSPTHEEVEELARELHRSVSLGEDASTSNQALLRVLERSHGVVGSDRYAKVTEKLADTSHDLHQYLEDITSVAREALATVDSLARSMEASEVQMMQLSDDVRQVLDVTTGIATIARQSNILSMNARIEAARSAEGSAFSIVAQEMEQLAEETKTMSGEILHRGMVISKSLGETAGKMAENRGLFHEAQRAIRALDHGIEVISSSSGALEDISSEVEALAYGHVQVQEHYELLQRYGNWTSQSLGGLSQDLNRTSTQVDGWCHPGEPGAVADLQQFEDVLVEALVEDRPQLARGGLEAALGEGHSAVDLLSRLSAGASRAYRPRLDQEVPIEVVYRNVRILEEMVQVLEPLVEAPAPRGGTVVLGNAFEDYHDLGRRLVASTLRAHGVRVIDLGLSVPNEKFLEVALAEGASVIGVSSLLLTTARWIPRLKQNLESMGRRDIKVIAGGAPFVVDSRLGRSLGVDGVGRNPDDALRLVRAFCGPGKDLR